MEDYDDSDQATGSPTAGESGFVHVESIDSPSVNSSSSSNQDDGVVVARVDTVQEEPSELKMTDEGGNEEFVDCPDDLVSYDGRTDMDENREDELVLEGQTTFGNDAGNLSHLYQEERRQLMTELTSLRYQLKGLIKKHELIGVSDGGPFTDEITSTLPLHEMINDCSRFIELAVNEQSQMEGSLRELYVNLDMKERTIEDLNMKVVEMSSAETVADRISSFVATVLGEEEFPETSVSGKLSHIEKNTSMIIQKYNRFLNQADMLNQCLAQLKSDYHIQIDMEKVLFVAREELVSLKRKEFELVHKSRYLENEYGKLMQHLEKSKETIEMLNSETGKLKGEVAVHKTRFNNTKEKLNLAVTKGKSLVQQRDSLKQVIVEKTSELDKCLIDLQEKSSALEAASSLKESLLQRDMVLRKCEEILTSGEEVQSLDIVDRVTWLANERMEFQKVTNALSAIELPEAAQHLDFESRVSWLLESLNVTKQESIKLQDEINTTKEAARAEVDRLTVSLLLETQEKNYLEEEFANLKDKNRFLQTDLQRSEEKGALLREKLSMAVKKGKGLVHERAEKNAQIETLKLELKQQEAAINEYMDQIRKCESLVQECAEKNAQIEALKLELKQQEATINDYRDQISKSGLVQERAENNAQVEALKLELKQQEATINDYRDQTSKCEGLVQERAEKNAQIEALKLELKQQEATTNDCMNQISKLSLEVGRIEKLESDLLRSEEEREQIKQWLVESNTLLQRVAEATDAIVFPVDLSDPVEKVKWCVAYTNECQVAKSKLEQELGDVKDEASMLSNKLTDTLTTMKSLEDALSVSEKHVIQLTEESKELEILKINTEEKLQKVNEEVSMHAINLNEAYRTIKSLEDATSQLQTHISQFSSENEKAVDDRNILKDEIKKFKEEAAYNEHKFMDASATVKTLEDALLKAENTILNLAGEEKNAEQEISTLNVQLNACRQELAEKQDRVVTLEHDIKVLRSACADVTKELKFIVEDNRMGIDSSHALGKLNYSVSSDVGPVDDVVVADIKVAEEMLCTARNVGRVIEHCVDVIQKMSTTIKDLQAELEETGSMYDKAKEENDILQSRVYKLDTELEASQNLHDEMSTKLDGYRAKEDEWDKREAELFMQSTAPMKDPEAENDLLSTSEVNSIFSKINGITIPFPNIVAGVIEVHDSDPVEKLFYIIDSVNELLDHINSLSHSKEELQSTLSKQALEIEHLKDELEEAIKDRKDFENMKKELYELSIGFEHIIREFGGDESDGGNKSANVAGMLPVLESLIHNIYLDSEREKVRAQDLGVKLSDTQKTAEELASKVKLLEDFNQNRTGLPDSIHERGGSEASSLPPRPEISEVEDPGSVGKRATPLVRTLRKGSNDHLALNIDPESDRLIDNQEILEDKGHIFKSLHTSGLVPSQGKIIADRLDGIWVSSGRALMSRPQARLGLIAYWVVLHLWLLGTLL